MTHDEIIENYVTKLGISISEAEQLLKDEMEDNLPDLTAEQKAVAKKAMQAERKKEAKPRVRERKVDADKVALIEILQSAIADKAESVSVTNSSREFEFIFNNRKFKVTLTATREKKDASL